MRSFESKLWKLPSWIYYSVAILATALVLGVRYQLGAVIPSGHVALLFVTVAVALSAFLGGLGPGVLSAIVGLLGAIYLFFDRLGGAWSSSRQPLEAKDVTA